MARYEPPNRYSTLTLLLSAASLILLLASVFAIQVISQTFGVVAGATIQAAADSRNVTAVLQQSASNINTLYNTLLAEYVSLIVAIGMLISAALLYRYKTNIFSIEAKGHITLHTMLTLIYFLLFFININEVLVNLNSSIYLPLVFGAALLCASIDAYVLFARYIFPARMARERGGYFAIDPSRPYSSLIMIKDQIFSQLGGSIGIVDKHMNSVGIENLHRLIQGNLDSLKAITILTSREMLDMEFSRNYLDCKREVENSGVKFNVMVMNDDDSGVQHERFVFDNKNAFKVPPFNIIHKKSEHITKIKLKEARERFWHLYKRSTKYENFVSKNGKYKEEPKANP